MEQNRLKYNFVYIISLKNIWKDCIYKVKLATLVEADQRLPFQ